MQNTSKSDARVLNGRCACGQIAYEVADQFAYAANCHCSKCRQATGSAFKPFGGIERSKFQVVQGADSLMIIGEPNGHDARCAKCGSYLYSVVRDGAFVHVTFGSLADDPTMRPAEHIFVGSKAPWYAINDSLPQYAEFPAAGNGQIDS
jgi:hypothetical protein